MPHTFVFTDLHSWGGMKNELDMKRFFSIVSMVAVMLVSCGKNSDPATPDGPENGGQDTGRKTEFSDFSLKTSTVYFGDEFEKYITVIDTNTVIISADAPEALVPLKGEVILVPASTANPYGFFGKVKSITRSGETQIETEPATLEDAFEELHIDEFINVSQLMDEVIDEDGNIIPCTPFPDEVWDNPQAVLDSLAQLPDTQTKADAGLAKPFTRSFPFNYGGVSGKVIFAATLAMSIDISKGVVIKDFDITLDKKIYIDVHAKLEKTVENSDKTEHLLPYKTISLPGSIQIGILSLRPAIAYALDFKASGKISIESNFGISVVDETARYHDGKWTNTPSVSLSNPAYASATYLDASGEIGLEARGGFQFGLYGQKLLAFGFDARPTFKIGLSGKISIDDKELLAKEASAEMELGGSVGLYITSTLLPEGGNEIRAAFNIPRKKWTVDLLDKGKGMKVEKESGEWSVSGSFGDRQFMEVDEKGIALFVGDEDNPLELKAMKSRPVSRSDAGGNAVSFEIPNDGRDYRVRPYNKVGEYYFYGNPITPKLIRSFHSGIYGIYSFSFYYDSNDRLVQATTSDGDIVSYSYNGNTIVYSDPGGRITQTAYLDSDGRLTKTVRSYNGKEDSYSFTYDDYNNPHFDGLIFTNGNFTGVPDELSCYYGEKKDNMNLDIFRTIVLGTRFDMFNTWFIPLLSFPYIHNNNLCTRVDFIDGYYNISYDFDEDGDVTKINFAGGTITLNYE